MMMMIWMTFVCECVSWRLSLLSSLKDRQNLNKTPCWMIFQKQEHCFFIWSRISLLLFSCAWSTRCLLKWRRDLKTATLFHHHQHHDQSFCLRNELNAYETQSWNQSRNSLLCEPESKSVFNFQNFSLLDNRSNLNSHSPVIHSHTGFSDVTRSHQKRLSLNWEDWQLATQLSTSRGNWRDSFDYIWETVATSSKLQGSLNLLLLVAVIDQKNGWKYNLNDVFDSSWRQADDN